MSWEEFDADRAAATAHGAGEHSDKVANYNQQAPKQGPPKKGDVYLEPGLARSHVVENVTRSTVTLHRAGSLASVKVPRGQFTNWKKSGF